MIEQKVIKKLNKLSFFNSNDEVFEFLEIIEDIASEGRKEYLPILFGFLSDNPDLLSVRDSIMIAIEYYPDNLDLLYLLSNLKHELSRIPDCCGDFLFRIMNSQKHLDCLKQNLHLADKETLLKLLDNMANDKYCPEGHKPIIAELRELVKVNK